MRSSAARFVLLLAVGAFLFWLALKGQNVALIREKLAHARWRWAALALVLAVVSNLLRAARWNLLIHPLGYRPRLVNTFGAVVVGYFANLALPRLGEVTRCAILLRYEQTPIDKVFGTVVTERIIDALTVLMCLALVVLLAFDRMASVSMQYIVDPIHARFESAFAHAPSFYFTIAAAGVTMVLGGRFLYPRFRESRYFVRLADAVHGFATGLRTVQHLEQWTLFVVLSILIWAMYALMSYSCFLCFPATAGLGLTAALAVLVFGAFGWAAPVQGGLGTFEIVVTPALVVFGVPANDALAYAILFHATQVFGMLTFGIVALVSLPIINRRGVLRRDGAPS
jgi:uncharacterized protein (TIRG00374 family)